MSIFGSIVSAIFGSNAQAATPAAESTTATTPAESATATAATGGGTAAAVTAKPMSRADVEAMIQKVADGTGRKNYNWKQSIVDLMKLLDLDSSLAARKELAQELGYSGKLDGSAEMNTWLHKEVMSKLMESGGAVPESLK